MRIKRFAAGKVIKYLKRKDLLNLAWCFKAFLTRVFMRARHSDMSVHASPMPKEQVIKSKRQVFDQGQLRRRVMSRQKLHSSPIKQTKVIEFEDLE